MNVIENVHLGAKDSFGTKLKKKIIGRIFKKKSVVPKDSLFFVASDVVPILYNTLQFSTILYYSLQLSTLYMYQRLISLEGIGLFKFG